MEIASYTSTGLVRKNNEDSCIVLPPWSSLAIKTKTCVFGVADGMGGESSGEIASNLAVESLREWVVDQSANDLSKGLMEELFTYANSAIWDYAQSHNGTQGMGTTLTVVVMKDNRTFVGHIGDSRLYRLRDGKFEQLTSDHTLVAEQVKSGKISKSEAQNHPSRHILSRVLGGRQFVVPDVFELDLKAGDKYLICTDGIYGLVSDEDMAEEIVASNILEIPKVLVAASNKAGGRDNSTAVAFEIDSLPIFISNYCSLGRIKKYLKSKNMAGFI